MTPNERMERSQWDPFWLPSDARVTDRPEILYVTCARPLFYLNQVLRTRVPSARVPALIAEVRAAHAHTPSHWNVFAGSDTDPDNDSGSGASTDALERALDDHGYTLIHNSYAMIQPVSEYRASPQAPTPRVHKVEDAQRLRHSLTIMESTFGHVQEHPESEVRELVRLCTGPSARIARMVAYDSDDRPIATGAVSLFPALDLAYLWGGCTVPEARGRGAYSALLAARVAYARARGIGLVGLYAITSTSAPIVAARGFVRCGRMDKWSKPALVAGA